MKANKNKSVFRQYSRSLYTISAFVFAIFSFAFLLIVVSIYFSANKLQILNTIQPNLPSGLIKPTTADITIPAVNVFRYENIEVLFPKNVWDKDFTFSYEPSAFERTKTSKSIMPTLKFKASDNIVGSITKMNHPFKITYTYSNADLKNIKEETITFYLYDEQSGNWEAVPTELDISRKAATAKSIYVTRYALMGEEKDKIAPVTYVTIEGKSSDSHKYESPVVIKLLAKDNNGGFGVKDTIYGINDEAWKDYLEPFVIENKGEYKISYQSSDLVGNVEDIKTAEIVIE
jgi:hypothetical protein